MSWAPLHNITHYSPCVGLSKPSELIKKCVEYGYKSCAITDNNSLSGAIAFYAAAKKSGIKPIIGTKMGNVILIAKNFHGWKNLIKITSSNNIFNYNEDNSIIAIAPHLDDESEFNIKGKFKEFYYMEDVGISKQPCLYVNDLDKEKYSIVLSADLGKKISDFDKWPESYKSLYNNFSALNTPSMTAGLHNDIITEQCEDYNILGELKLPSFPIPKEFANEYEYLLHLCRDGWKKKIAGKGLDENLYADRVKKELSVIKNVGLEGYFLIVQDYINWAKQQDWLVGPSRGSCGGSLVCYLLNITEINPIQYGLIFERFYNEGRNTKDNKELPDIDTDFPKFKRDNVIQYIKSKYGENKVAHIITYLELKGKSSLKEVLRAYDVCSVDEMNQITKHIPSKEEISDDLVNDDETSILSWTLKHEPDILKDWATIDENGIIHGKLSKFFEKAIELEGTFIGTGKHASGIIISKDTLAECCPMTIDKNGDSLAALDMRDLQKAGFVKFDILGVAVLDKLMGVNNLLQYGRINV